MNTQIETASLVSELLRAASANGATAAAIRVTEMVVKFDDYGFHTISRVRQDGDADSAALPDE